MLIVHQIIEPIFTQKLLADLANDSFEGFLYG